MASAIQFTTGAPTAVAIQTTARTMLEIVATSTKPLTLKEMNVSFNGSAAAAGILVELCYLTATGTGTASTVRASDQFTAPSISAAAKYNDTVEPSVSFVFFETYIPPSQFDRWVFPLGDEFRSAVSCGFGIRVTGAASNTPNCLPTMILEEG
jgi:hypothetical protein